MDCTPRYKYFLDVFVAGQAKIADKAVQSVFLQPFKTVGAGSYCYLP
jgi:hypothetical protein